MSKENVKLFYEKAAKDENLQKEINNLYVHHQEELQKSIIKLGAADGYEFSTEDMNELAEEAIATMQQNGELSDEQMEAITGGGMNNISNHYYILPFVPKITPTIPTEPTTPHIHPITAFFRPL